MEASRDVSKALARHWRSAPSCSAWARACARLLKRYLVVIFVDVGGSDAVDGCELLDVPRAGVQELLFVGAPVVVAEVLIHHKGSAAVALAIQARARVAETVRGVHSVL